MKRVLAVIKNKPDRAMFLVAYRHGLRASEIGLLARRDLDLKRGRIIIQRVKGSHADTVKLLRWYLESRRDDIPYVFTSKRGLPIDRRTLWWLMQKYGGVAGFPPEKQRLHSPFRRSRFSPESGSERVSDRPSICSRGSYRDQRSSAIRLRGSAGER